jgi:hypothetical protein
LHDLSIEVALSNRTWSLGVMHLVAHAYTGITQNWCQIVDILQDSD